MMIDDMLRQNWSTLHSHSIDLRFRHSAKAGQGSQRSRHRTLWIDRRSISPNVTACSPRSFPFSRCAF